MNQQAAITVRAGAAGPDRVRFLARRFEDCQLFGPFQAVAGSSVLHHLEVEPSLRKLFDLLAPGGYLSFAEPNMLNPQILVQKNVPFVKRWLTARALDS